MEILLRNSYVIKIQLKLVILFATLLSAGILLLSPLILGLKYLDPLATAVVLERYVSLIGILLITPLFYAEQDKNIAELLDAKNISQPKIVLVRLVLALTVLFVMVLIMLLIMYYYECEFPFGKYLMFSCITAMSLGTLGFAGAGISNNVIIGYLLPAVYYILNLGLGTKLGYFYLFSMSRGSYEEKYWLLGTAVLLILATFLVRYIVNRVR